jgi:hypothetical protein
LQVSKKREGKYPMLSPIYINHSKQLAQAHPDRYNIA